MARNWLRVQHEGDSIQLSWQRGQSNPRSAPAVALQHPFDDQALTDLRWYLEEYLRFPYGLAPENAAKIEQKFQIWGEQLFELVFRRSEKAREFFHEATREGLDRCELVISSDNPAVLNLPWELLYSPDYQFLAPLLGGMSRSLNSQAVRSEMGQLPQDKLNILLVIARPYGERDIALKTIARPMLEVAAQIRQNVNIKVLRPPSFEQFERELNAHKGFYFTSFILMGMAILTPTVKDFSINSVVPQGKGCWCLRRQMVRRKLSRRHRLLRIWQIAACRFLS